MIRRWLRRLFVAALVLFAAAHALILVYRVVPPPITPLMLIRLAEGEGLMRSWTALSDIARWLPVAAIAAEDNRFCRHHGIDWDEMAEAWREYRSGERMRGASTVTMQVARNLMLWPGRDFVRKAIEAYLALVIDLAWPKTRIMEVYLNIIEWGLGVYGAEAASRAYFHKPASALTPRESALLVTVLPNPREWHPDQPTPFLNERTVVVRERMEQLGTGLLSCVRANG
jgi:monofunctional biosynthetic peptidoglycan transglycosylase